MKLLDIENTVERATRNAAACGATFLTVHAHDAKTLRAAWPAAPAPASRSSASPCSPTWMLPISASRASSATPADLVARRAALVRDAGCHGIVASGLEAARVRAIVGPHLTIVTPGIRLPGGTAGDQTRVAGPREAIAAGADYLVVGRPIAAAADPAPATEVFLRHIEEGLAQRTRGPAG